MSASVFENEFAVLGFGENETRIYTVLLEFGALHPSELAQRTGLNRSYLYDLLNRMVEKGYLSTVKTDEKLCFQAVAPTQLVELFTSRASAFRELIPRLDALRRPRDDTTIELHRGKGVFRTLIKDMLVHSRRGEEILVISANEAEFEAVEPVMLKQYYRGLREGKTGERVLIKAGARKIPLTTTTGRTQYRELPYELVGNSSMFVYSDTVAEIVFGNPNYLTFTRNREMTAARRKLFEHLWVFAGKNSTTGKNGGAGKVTAKKKQ